MDNQCEIPKFNNNFPTLNEFSMPPTVPQRNNVPIIQSPGQNYNPLFQSYPNSYYNNGNFGFYNQGYNMGSSMKIDNQLMGSFNSLNNVVQSLNALNMLVNTAYGAVYTSISTLNNASEQISRTKNQFFHILSSINIFKAIKRFVSYLRKIVSGEMQPTMSDVTSLLGEITRTFISADPSTGGHALSALFFITIICGPIIIYKYIRNTSNTATKSDASRPSWNSQIGKSYAAKVKADFFSRNPDELTVKTGDIVTIAPPEFQKEVNWYLVSNLRCEQGLIPASFVTVMGVLDKSKNDKETD